MIRDAVILGLLDKVGVNLSDEVIAKLRGVDPSSENVDCSVAGDNWSVSSGEYAGGFTGIAANSDLSKITVSGLKNVTVSVKTYMNESTTGYYGGGLAGRATLGSSLILIGDEDLSEKGLLGQVGSLLSGALAGDGSRQILNLLGISASELRTCTVAGNDLCVQAQDYTGGLIGQGDGVQIGQPESNQDSQDGNEAYAQDNTDLSSEIN